MTKVFPAILMVCATLLMNSCSEKTPSGEPVNASTSQAADPSQTIQIVNRDAPPTVGEEAPDFSLFTPDQKSFSLSKQIGMGPVVLVVLRGWPGYQCPICTRQVGELLTHSDDLREAKAHVVLVYPGPADQLTEHAKEFVSGKSLPDHFSFVIDPEYVFTLRYGLRWDAPKETAYPSTFVIDRQGIVRYAKVSKSHGDRADIAEILQALADTKE